MINWKVRIRNKNFWIAIIPAFALLIQLIAALFGFTIDLTEVSGKLLAIVDAVFAILVIMGIIQDPTTKGIRDSETAMTYEKPKEK